MTAIPYPPVDLIGDGPLVRRHRLVASRVCGFSHVPVVVYPVIAHCDPDGRPRIALLRRG